MTIRSCMTFVALASVAGAHLRTAAKTADNVASSTEASFETVLRDERLKELLPLLGEWRCKTNSATIESAFHLVVNGHFIEHDHTLRMFGRTHRVKELIGWDPKTKTVTGWIFTPNGVATSRYHKTESGWSIEAVLTRSDGTTSTKRKTLVVNDKQLKIDNEVAPLPEFLKLEFQRTP